MAQSSSLLAGQSVQTSRHPLVQVNALWISVVFYSELVRAKQSRIRLLLLDKFHQAILFETI
jgi:hypothetical protein